jgi:prevent-host-death family protein
MKTAKSKKPVDQVSISEFKAKCLSLLEQVNKTKAPLRVTRRGKPIADVIPASPENEPPRWIGSMSDRIELIGDIVSPVVELDDIEAMQS